MVVIVRPDRWLALETYREPASKDEATGQLIMQPSRGHRRLAWKLAAGVTFVISGTLIRGFGAGPLGWWWPATLVGLLMLLGSMAMLLSLRRRLYLTDRGLLSKPAVGRQTFIAWNDIERVRFHKWSRELRVHGRKSETVAIPSTMSGTQDLEDMMKKRLPPQVFITAFIQHRASLKKILTH